MTVKELLESEYTQLCQVLGDLTLKQNKLNKQADAVKAKIDALLDLSPKLQELDAKDDE